MKKNQKLNPSVVKNVTEDSEIIAAKVDQWLDLVRLDKNLFYNLPDLKINFAEDADLAKDIIIYIAHSYKADLFGYSNFSISDFCKTMGYKAQNLHATHKHIKEAIVKALTFEVHEFKSLFEYTLYRLASRTIPLSRIKKTANPSLKEVNVRFVQVFTDLKVKYDVNKPDRRLYSYRLGQAFLENMLQFYVTVSLSNYLKVADNKNKGRIRSLYIYLSGMRHVLFNANSKKMTPNFDLLCEIAELNQITEPRYKKQKLTTYLKQISAESDLKFDVNVFASSEQKQAYSIELDFKDDFTMEGERNNALFKALNTNLREV